MVLASDGILNDLTWFICHCYSHSKWDGILMVLHSHEVITQVELSPLSKSTLKVLITYTIFMGFEFSEWLILRLRSGTPDNPGDSYQLQLLPLIIMYQLRMICYKNLLDTIIKWLFLIVLWLLSQLISAVLACSSLSLTFSE